MKLIAWLRRNRVAEAHAPAKQQSPKPPCADPPCWPEDNYKCTTHRRISLVQGCSCFMLRTSPLDWVKVPCDLHDPRLWEELERMVRG